MKKSLSYIAAIAALTVLPFKASAQQLQSAYFMDAYVYGHQLNPAHDFNSKAYVSIPVLGNLNMGVNGNLGVDNLLYPRNGQLVTYLHPSISVEEALGNFHSNNKIQMDFTTSIFSFGIHKWKGFNTLEVNLRMNGGFNAPYDMFELTKDLQNRNYNLSAFGANAQAYAEVALGHSREVYKGIRAGAKLKFLVGAGRVDAQFSELRLDLQDDSRWVAVANATVNTHVKGLKWGEMKVEEYENGGTYETIDFDNVDFEGSKGIAGVGMALDLGAEADFGKLDLVPNLKAGIAIRDLGFLKWKEGISARNAGQPFVFEGFQDIKVQDGPGTDIEDQTDDLTDRLTDLYRLEDAGVAGGRNTGLGTTLALSAEYALPMYDKLTFGFTSTSRIQKNYGWNEERLYVTVKPLRKIEASVNAGIGTFGPSWGWAVNLGYFFMGMDHMLGKLTKQGVPVRSNADFRVGFVIPFGGAPKKR